MPPATEIALFLGIGLVTGVIGGLVGFGGSVILIPILVALLHRDQHVAQAASMIVNVAVAGPALWRHQTAGAVPWKLVRRMLPMGILFILLGVAASNQLPGDTLRRLFGIFLLYVVASDLWRQVRDRRQAAMGMPPREERCRHGWGPASVVGSAIGMVAGLLGTGGGPVAVPLAHRLCRCPLRSAIAASAAVMCITSIVGAWRKNATLSTLPELEGTGALRESLIIAASVSPTAIVGAVVGASLTHVLPVFWVRLVLLVLLTWSGAAMLAA